MAKGDRLLGVRAGKVGEMPNAEPVLNYERATGKPDEIERLLSGLGRGLLEKGSQDHLAGSLSS
jgi:hypothetical protein